MFVSMNVINYSMISYIFSLKSNQNDKHDLIKNIFSYFKKINCANQCNNLSTIIVVIK